jgi:hypothetical protein
MYFLMASGKMGVFVLNEFSVSIIQNLMGIKYIKHGAKIAPCFQE